MKKIIAMLLAVMLVVSMAACGAKTESKDNGAQETTAAKVEVPESALVILETVWNAYAEDDKFPVFGGNQDENANMEGPGAFKTEDTDGLTYLLLVPADLQASIDGAASMVHMMNSNTFTCAAYHINGDVKAFADGMKAAVTGNRWMCGMPDQLLITVIGGEYVLVAFGVNDAMNPFMEKLAAAYPAAQQLYLEALA